MRRTLNDDESEGEKQDPYQNGSDDDDDISDRCQQCNAWAHAEYAGVSKRIKIYICELCN